MSEERKSAVYHYLESGEHMVFCAPWFRREGLCLFIYSDHDLAVAAASEKARLYGYDIDLGETTDIIGYLRRMADLGFAGAVLNDLVPVIFCRDAEGLPVFLRSLQNHEGGFSHFERMLDDGTWEAAAGMEGVAPLVDQKRFDRLISGLVGDVPFRGYQDSWKPMTWSDVATGEMPIIDAAEGAAPQRADSLRGRSYLPIFSTFDYLQQFVTERGIDPSTVQRRDVEDLAGLARLAAQKEALVLLNPGQHRADTAALGCRENGVALTSFSGRWFSSDGQRFRTDRGEASTKEAKPPASPPKTLAEELAQREMEEPEALPETRGGEAPEITLDTTLEAVELAVTREQVTSGSVNQVLSFICSSFGDPETLLWAGGRFHFRFVDAEEGQDPYADAEVQQWLRSLERLLPVLSYFLSDGDGGQRDVARALLQTPAEGDEEDPPPSFAEYVEDRSLMILAMGEKYGIETRVVCESFAAAFSHRLPDHFFIDPDNFDHTD